MSGISRELFPASSRYDSSSTSSATWRSVLSCAPMSRLTSWSSGLDAGLGWAGLGARLNISAKYVLDTTAYCLYHGTYVLCVTASLFSVILVAAPPATSNSLSAHVRALLQGQDKGASEPRTAEPMDENKAKSKDKVLPPVIFAEDMSEEWSKDAVKAAREAFALTSKRSSSALSALSNTLP